MKIMIAGDKGQLGTDCVQVFGKTHDVLSFDLDEADITNASEVESWVLSFAPDIIINCAAYTQVDSCEAEKDLSWKVNVKGPENLAKSLKKIGGLLIHISTDYVFDGNKRVPEPYVETDDPLPVSHYGKTKYQGEKKIKQIIDRYVILRTAWMYGINGNNFLKTMLKLALKNPENQIKVVNDQFGSPTWSHRLALQIAQVVDANEQGVYHATAEGHCSWYDLAKYFLDKMDVPHAVVPCSSDEYPTHAARPKNSILENRHLKEKSINIMKHWRDDVDQFIANFRECLLNETIQGNISL